MSRVILRECNFCGKKYGYMASGYGVSPYSVNRKNNVGWYYCSDCSDKKSDFWDKAHDIKDDIDRWQRKLSYLFMSKEKSAKSLFDCFAFAHIERVWPRMISIEHALKCDHGVDNDA